MMCHHTKHELYTNAGVAPPKSAQLASWYCWCKIIINNGRAPCSDMIFTLTKRNGQMKLLIWLQLCSVAMDTPLTMWSNYQVPTFCCLSAIYSYICRMLHCYLNSCKGLCTYPITAAQLVILGYSEKIMKYTALMANSMKIMGRWDVMPQEPAVPIFRADRNLLQTNLYLHGATSPHTITCIQPNTAVHSQYSKQRAK
jgi:hypothetical protein